MKTLLITVILLSFSILSSSQTEEIEVKNLADKYASGKINLETYRQIGKEWQDLISFFGGFPGLPVNDLTKEVELKKVFSYGNIPLKVIYDRIMEWSAINFGKLESVLHYSSLENGKIILKGYFEVFYTTDYQSFFFGKKEKSSKVKCYHTYIFTIKDKSLKIEVLDLKYIYYFPSYTIGTTYFPSSEIESPLTSLYPITDSDPIEWKGRLDLLNQTNIKISELMNSIDKYISNKSVDYNF